MKSGGHHPVGHRAERIGEEIRNEVSLMLAGELKDPRLAVPLIVTEVRLAAGMRTVRVFVRLEGDTAERAEALKGLKAASLSGRYRSSIATYSHDRWARSFCNPRAAHRAFRECGLRSPH